MEGSSYTLPIDERGEDEWKKTVIDHTTATDGTAYTSHLTGQLAYQQAQHGRVN